jgi:hypothetical protein
VFCLPLGAVEVAEEALALVYLLAAGVRAATQMLASSHGRI